MNSYFLLGERYQHLVATRRRLLSQISDFSRLLPFALNEDLGTILRLEAQDDKIVPLLCRVVRLAFQNVRRRRKDFREEETGW
jgi:hypothetical protein